HLGAGTRSEGLTGCWSFFVFFTVEVCVPSRAEQTRRNTGNLGIGDASCFFVSQDLRLLLGSFAVPFTLDVACDLARARLAPAGLGYGHAPELRLELLARRILAYAGLALVRQLSPLCPCDHCPVLSAVSSRSTCGGAREYPGDTAAPLGSIRACL